MVKQCVLAMHHSVDTCTMLRLFQVDNYWSEYLIRTCLMLQGVTLHEILYSVLTSDGKVGQATNLTIYFQVSHIVWVRYISYALKLYNHVIMMVST